MGRVQKRTRAYAKGSSGGKSRARYSGRAGPSNLGSGAVGGRRRQNVRTAGFLGIEHKFYDTFLVDGSVASSLNATGGMVDPSATSLISTVPQGDTASSRDGKRIVIESIQVTGNVSSVAHSGLSVLDDTPEIWIALVMDTQTNAATMTSEAAFSNPGGALATSCSPLKNLLSGSRFQTLKIWNFQLPMPSCTANDTAQVLIMGQSVPFDFYKKCEIVVDFNGGTTAVVGNVVNNSLHMIAFSSDSSWNVKINYNARIRFVG